MGKRSSTESPCTSPTSVQEAKRQRAVLDGMLKDEGKLGTLTRYKLSKLGPLDLEQRKHSAFLNSPYTEKKHRTILMNKKKLEKARNSSLLDTDEDKENDTLNLIHWKKVHGSQVEQVEQLLESLKTETQKNTTEEEYWTTEIDRCNGEGQLYLGKKSKLTQFGDMCQDPKNAKYNVQKEQDLQAFWDGMVFPSVEAFIKRAKWLIAAAQGNFADEHKAKNPNQLQKAIQKPRPKAKIDLAKKSKDDEKLAAQKKKAEERRAEMRKKMLELKRQKMKQLEQN